MCFQILAKMKKHENIYQIYSQLAFKETKTVIDSLCLYKKTKATPQTISFGLKAKEGLIFHHLSLTKFGKWSNN